MTFQLWQIVLAIVVTGTGAFASVLIFFVKRFESETGQNASSEVKEEIAVKAAKDAKTQANVFANATTVEQSIEDMKKGDF